MSQHPEDMQVGWIRKALMIMLFLALSCLDITASPVIFPASIDLSLTFAAIFYISLLTPFTLPYIFIMVIGLLMDLLSNGPFGLYMFLFCGALWLLRTQKTYLSTQTFVVIWLVYGLLAGLLQLFIWMGYNLYTGGVLPIDAVLVNTLFSFLIFPVILSLFHVILRAFPSEDKDL